MQSFAVCNLVQRFFSINITHNLNDINFNEYQEDIKVEVTRLYAILAQHFSFPFLNVRSRNTYPLATCDPRL